MCTQIDDCWRGNNIFLGYGVEITDQTHIVVVEIGKKQETTARIGMA
jgi:hypothetical protein